MTERGLRTGVQGAPNPAEPSHSGDSSAPTGRSPAVDLGAVRRTDAVIESLAAWRAAGPAGRPEGGRPARTDDDPAVRLLRALITDVDDQGPGRDARVGEGGPEPAPPTPPGPGPRRRGPRTIVALGVAGAVLASTGVAAAGPGGGTDHSTASPSPVTPGVSEEPDETPAPDVDAGTVGTGTGEVVTGTGGTGTVGRPRPPAARSAPRPSRSTARRPPGGPVRTDAERIGRRLRDLFPPEGRGLPPPEDRPRTSPSIVIMSTDPSITITRVDPRVAISRTAPSRRTARSPEADLRRRLAALRRAAGQRY